MDMNKRSDARILCAHMGENLRAPKAAPKTPPIAAARARLMKSECSVNPFCACPQSPESEFAKMKKLAAADASLTLTQRRKISAGQRKIPPPTPATPETKPIKAPNGTPIAHTRFDEAGGRTSYSALAKKMRSDAAKRQMPSKPLKVSFGREICAPKKTAGTAAAIKGRTMRGRKCPARLKSVNVMADTARLQKRAVARASEGVAPFSVSAKRYDEPPANPPME